MNMEWCVCVLNGNEILNCQLIGVHHLSRIERYDRVLMVTYVNYRIVQLLV